MDIKDYKWRGTTRFIYGLRWKFWMEQLPLEFFRLAYMFIDVRSS